MPIYRGNTKVVSLYRGTTKIVKVYKGTNVVYTSSRLPAEFQEVAYIESTGTQYIDSGWYSKDTDTVECKFEIINQNALQSGIYGATTTVNSFTLLIRNPITARVGQPNQQATSQNIQLNTIYNTTLSKSLYKENGIDYTFDGSSSFTLDITTLLFARNHTTGAVYRNPIASKIYSCKIYDNGTLVRDYIPCYRKSDRVIGLYDTVNDVFYVNAGTGEFKRGPIVDIPNAYQEVEYIESSGTQYIDSGVNAQSGLTLYSIFQSQNITQTRIVGASTGGYDAVRLALLTSAGDGYLVNQYGTINNILSSYTLDTNKHSLENDNGTLKYDGIVIDTTTAQTFDIQKSLYVFASRSTTILTSYIRIMCCSISNNNVLVRDFIPVYRKSDNVIGLYDLVNGVFYTNAGTGTFTKGSNIE